MSQRERPASRGRRPADRPTATAGPSTPVSWDELYDRLPPGARARLIAAASDTGVVAGDQVPTADSARHLLHGLLAGDGLDDLAPLVTAPIDDLPDNLDPQQRAAVALALRTPDIALVQGLPGTGKSRITAEAVALAARRGERVLLVAPDAAALDRVLELLADRPEVCPLRCLDADESDVPPAAARCTFAAHTHRLTEQARVHAQERIAAAVATCRRRDAEAAVYDHLLDLAEQHHRLQARSAECSVLSAEPEPLSTEESALITELAARRTDADRARTAVLEIEPTMAALRPLAAARAAGRWWTLAYWKATSDATTRLADAEAKHGQATAYAAAIEQEAERIATAQADLVAEQAARRRTELADETTAIEREVALVTDKWQQALRQLPAAGPRPKALNPDAATVVRDTWGRSRDVDRGELEFARAWADGLEPLLEALPGRLLEAINLVAATPTALAADAHFGAGRRGLFDVLIVEEAHTIADADLLAAARRARRWVLVGEPEATNGRQSEPERQRGNFTKPLAGARARTAIGSFPRLWNLLHYDLWAREGERLICRLRFVPAAARGKLDREPVADRPTIELRIHTPVGGEPELAEVAFPAGTTVVQAVEYVFQELGELAAAGEPSWEETAERRIARWRTGTATATANLGDGVRALVIDAGVIAVEFDRAAGWDRERSTAWVRRHAGRCGPGRAVRLETPHRMAPGLAEVVGELLGAGSYLGPASNGAAPCVEFVPVPSAGVARPESSKGVA
jgi:hypothetical protein